MAARYTRCKDDNPVLFMKHQGCVDSAEMLDGQEYELLENNDLMLPVMAKRQ